MNRKKAIIIGANFAGLSAAGQLSALRANASEAVDVTLIDPQLDFEWTPNIHEILSGIKSRRQVRISRPVVTQRLGHEFILDEVTEVDANKRWVKLKHGGTRPFDACLIACGHTVDSLGMEETRRHSIAFRAADDVNRISDRIQKAVSSREILKVVIVGGGFSGIEALGELLRKFSQHQNISICVVEPSKRLLNGLPEVIADDVLALAKALNTEFLLNRQVTSIDDQGLMLDGGTRLDAGLVIWTAGTELPEFVTNTNLDSVGRRGIPVNDRLQSTQFEQVFVAGDAAALESPLRKQAYHALDMGTLAGKNIWHWLQAEPLQTFSPLEKPMVLAFGDLNTYLIQGQTVIASPVLSAVKEVVYQLYMAQISRALAASELGRGITDRFLGSVQNLLLPEISKLKLLNLVRKSRVLQRGNLGDMEMMVKAVLGTLTK